MFFFLQFSLHRDATSPCDKSSLAAAPGSANPFRSGDPAHLLEYWMPIDMLHPTSRSVYPKSFIPPGHLARCARCVHVVRVTLKENSKLLLNSPVRSLCCTRSRTLALRFKQNILVRLSSFFASEFKSAPQGSRVDFFSFYENSVERTEEGNSEHKIG